MKKSDSFIKQVFRRLLKNKLAMIGGIIFLIFIFIGIFANVIAPHDPTEVDVVRRLQPPSSEFWLGTDNMGRCVLSRLISGAQNTLICAVLVILGIMAVGTPLGLISGYYGGWADNLIMRAADIVSAFPSSLLALAVVSVLGSSVWNVMLVLVALWWAPFARILRSEILKVKEKTFVQAAEASGATKFRIVTSHILLNSISSMIVFLTLRFAAVIMHIAAFSFIGLGTQPPAADWGVMLSDARPFITTNPLLLVWPGAAIMITVFSLNMFGEGLNEALRPAMSEGARKELKEVNGKRWIRKARSFFQSKT